MDPRSIIENGHTNVPLHADASMREWPGTNRPTNEPASEVRFPGEDGGKSLAEMAERDLGATLQLLAERAQYITGATGGAIALLDGEVMVCKATAGTSAPSVGTQLQVNSGLSGESVRTQQTLVCEDASTDTRVNRESCEALGIASVVVMPLLREGLVIGVFELFSDRPHAFSERDLTALERLGSMVHTAIDCAAAASTMPEAPAAETRTETGVVIPMSQHPAPLRAETPGNELFQRTGADETRSQGPVAVAPRLVFHGRNSGRNPEAVQSAAEAAAVGNGAQSGLGEAVRPEPTAEQIAFAQESDDILMEAEVAHAELRTHEESTGQEEAPAIETVSPAEAGPWAEQAAPAAAKSGPGIDAPHVAANPAVAPATPDAVSDMFEAPSPKPLAPKPRPVDASPEAAKARSEVAALRQCQTCGFPISPGRVLCIDCEKKARAEGKPVPAVAAPVVATAEIAEPPAAAPAAQVEEPIPFFLGAEEEVEPESWVSTHKYIVAAVAMAVMGIVALLLSR
jgi:putative methionine-R-sulfoxide reductase with GAF domain